MKKKFIKKAFTLVELIVVISIGGILLAISTNWYMSNVVASNVKNNRVVDLQSGVKTSMDMVKNTLKNTTQVHLVGKNVYDPDLTLEQLKTKNLDTNYNYIALSKDSNGNYSLINLLYNKAKKEFESFPISAEIRNDNLDKNTLSYSMSFYKGDSDYKKKLNKNLLHITISGNIHDVDDKEGKKGKTFELSENIDLQNVNQILVSKHLQGGIENVTAIAYDNAKIETETASNKVKKMAFVFILDVSGSMKWNLGGTTASTSDEMRISIARKNIKTFIDKINKDGQKNNIAIDAYIFTFSNGLTIDAPSIVENKYLYDIKQLVYNDPLNPTQTELNKKRYGPFLLGKQVSNTKEKADSHIDILCKNPGGGTNVGKALLQGCELLNQLKDVDRKFLILLTDGLPQGRFIVQYENNNRYENNNMYGMKRYIELKKYYDDKNKSLPEYQKWKFGNFFDVFDNGKDYTGLAMNYIKEVTEPINENNLENTFDHAYLIGFSGLAKDKSRLGIPDDKGKVNQDSIAAYLDRGKGGTSKKRVNAYDADTEDALQSAFDNIVESIGNIMGAFDGPSPLTK